MSDLANKSAEIEMEKFPKRNSESRSPKKSLDSQSLESKCDRWLRFLQIFFTFCFFGLGLIFFAISTSKVDKFMKSIPDPHTQTMLSYISTNLDRIPYIDITSSSTPICPPHYEMIPLGTFPGTINLCNCTSSNTKTFTFSPPTCSNSDHCRVSPGFTPQAYYVWDGMYLCGLKPTAFIANRLDCPMGHIKCYAGGCASATEGCPITDIAISTATAMTDYTKVPLNNSKNLFFKKGAGIPIVAFNITSSPPCVGEQYPSTDVLSPYQAGEFRCRFVDPEAVLIDSISASDLLSQNGFTGITHRYSTGETDAWATSNKTFSLYSRKRISLNDSSEACYSFDDQIAKSLMNVATLVKGSMLAATVLGLLTTSGAIVVLIANMIKPGLALADYGSNRFYLITENSDGGSSFFQIAFMGAVAVFSTVLTVGIGGSEYYTAEDRDYFQSYKGCFGGTYAGLIELYEDFQQSYNGLAFAFVGPVVVVDLFYILNTIIFVLRKVRRHNSLAEKSSRLIR